MDLIENAIIACKSLGGLYYEQAESTGELIDAETSIQYYQSAMKYIAMLDPLRIENKKEFFAFLWHDIGSAYFMRNDERVDPEETLGYFKKALQLKEEFFGPDNLHLTVTFLNMGKVCEDADNAIDAEEYYQRAYDIGRPTLGEAHRITMKAKSALKNLKKQLYSNNAYSVFRYS